jgi:hypothetical protein
LRNQRNLSEQQLNERRQSLAIAQRDQLMAVLTPSQRQQAIAMQRNAQSNNGRYDNNKGYSSNKGNGRYDDDDDYNGQDGNGRNRNRGNNNRNDDRYGSNNNQGRSWPQQGTYNGRSLQGTIYGSTTLQTDQRYYSPNQQYYFNFQGDGNLVVYRAANNASLWSSGTNNRNVVSARLQNDGNLVLTDASGRIVWDAFANQSRKYNNIVESAAARTARRSRNALVMQDDGNLVIYTSNSRSIRWATDTNQ